MLLTNLLLACGLSTAVGSGLALKENSNYLHHEKSHEQLHLENKKNAVDGDLELNTWYYTLPYFVDENGGYYANLLDEGTFSCSFDILINENLYQCNSADITDYGLIGQFVINDNVGSALNVYFDSLGDNEIPIYFRFQSLPSNGYPLEQFLTLSDNQDIGGSTTQEVFEVVGDTTTGFIDVLTSAIQNGTELIYKDGNFTFLGVMLLVATGVSVVFWIFRLLRGITEGVSR